jgi:chaperonin cofactor prefoldin
MDWQNLINISAGSLLAIGGWFARQLWDSVKELKSDIATLRLHVSETYTKKSEVETLEAQMEKRFDRLEQMIARLYDKIDSKADK